MKTYRITELAELFGLSRSTLLYYDKIGLLCPTSRSQTEYRIYNQKDMQKLEKICFFRKAGLSLSEIATLLQNSNTHTQILETRLRTIGHEVAELQSQQRLLTGILKTLSAGAVASGLNKDLWLSLQKASGLDEAALKEWHTLFEQRAPTAHHDFLLHLGLSEKEAIHVRMLTKNIEDNSMRMHYFYELFEDLPRQGPGSEEATLRALSFLKDLPVKPKVLDIGCGSGQPTKILARRLNTKILAIDNHGPFLSQLVKNLQDDKLDIETRELSMINMPFNLESFDLLWAEGSIFIIGLERGLKDFSTFIKPNGYLAFTEMCWFEKDPPAEIKAYLNEVYPDIKTTDEVCALALKNGYTVLETFNLPESAWWDDFYRPLEERLKILKVKNQEIKEAQAVYQEHEKEIEMFRRYSKYYGYTFFILQKEEDNEPN